MLKKSASDTLCPLKAGNNVCQLGIGSPVTRLQAAVTLEIASATATSTAAPTSGNNFEALHKSPPGIEEPTIHEIERGRRA